MPAMKTGDIHSINQQDNDALLLAEQSLLLLQKEQIIEKKSEVISEQKKRIAILEEALRLSKIKRFAPSSEKSNQQYGIERSIKEFTADKKYQVRQEKSVLILKQLREYLEKTSTRCLKIV